MVGELIEAEARGLKELARVLDKLPRRIGERDLNAGLRAGARIVLAEAQRLVPVRSGNLQRSLRIRRAPKGEYTVEGLANTRLGTGHVILETGKRKGADGYYGHMVEFGTRKMPAQPFMRPALLAKREAAVKRTGEFLYKRVQTTTRKLAGPLSKSGLLRRR